jgi:stress response protein SCP2
MLITKGQRVKLSEITNGKSLFEINVAVELDGPGRIIYLCLGLDCDKRFTDTRYLIGPSSRVTPDLPIRLAGKFYGNNTSYLVKLSDLPPHVVRLAFMAFIHGPGAFNQITYGHLKIMSNNVEIARFVFSGLDFTYEKGIIMGEIYLHQDQWRLASIGDGFVHGLDGLLSHYGASTAAGTISASVVKAHLTEVVANYADDTDDEEAPIGTWSYTDKPRTIH